MNTSLHYKHPPITEALIDLQVVPSSKATLESMRTVHNGYESTFPIEEQQFFSQVDFGIDVPQARHEQIGYLYRNPDSNKIVQFRLDGFTFNQLKPYDTWATFRDEARSLWQRYREVAQPTAIRRLALRYVNRLLLPAHDVDLKRYIMTFPHVSEKLSPNGLSGYFMQLHVPQIDISAMLVLSQALERMRPQIDKAESLQLSVILDIDVFRVTDVPDDEQAIWNYFETLRIKKNQVFESSITDDMREILNHDND